MTDAEKERLRALRDMLGSKGWEHFMEELTAQRDALQSNLIYSATDEKQLYFSKGAFQIMQFVLNYEKLVTAAEDSPEDTYAAPV